MPEEGDSRTIKVYGDKHAKERQHPTVAYERVIHATSVMFICQRCHNEVTEVHFPGPVRYCAACSAIVTREKARARTQRARERKKQEQN